MGVTSFFLCTPRREAVDAALRWFHSSDRSRRRLVVVFNHEDNAAGFVRLQTALGLSPFGFQPGFQSFEKSAGTVLVVCGEPRALAGEIEGEIDFLAADAQDVPFWERRLHAGSELFCFENCRLSSRWESIGEGRSRLVRGRKRAEPVPAPEAVIIAGAGIAGALAAYECSKRGIRPIVFEAGPVPGSGASALCAAITHPHWQRDDNPLFQLTRQGWIEMMELLESFPSAFEPCGVMDAAADDEEEQLMRNAALKGEPFSMAENFARYVDAAEGERLTGLELRRGGWFYPRAGLIRPARLIHALLGEACAPVLTQTCIHLRRSSSGVWQAVHPMGAVLAEAPAALLAAGLNSPSAIDDEQCRYAMSGLYGRISILREDSLSDMRVALTGSGYGIHIEGFDGIGATYEPDRETMLSPEMAHEHNRAAWSKLLRRPPEWRPEGFYEGMRAVTRDRLPAAGAMPARQLPRFHGRPEVKAIPKEPGLWGLFALGSRGMTWGRTAAKLVAAKMAGAPADLPKSMARRLSPARFVADESFKR